MTASGRQKNQTNGGKVMILLVAWARGVGSRFPMVQRIVSSLQVAIFLIFNSAQYDYFRIDFVLGVRHGEVAIQGW